MGGNSMRWFGAIGASFVIAMALALYLKDQIAFARIATAYVAQQTCACLHVSARSEASCRSDYRAEDIARISVTQTGQEVRASVLGGLVSAKSRNSEGYGCTLQP